ncbi:MAG: phosphoribosylglycinamide formyltransferase [Sulfurimonas sp.]|nr:phosphoribosylglycinamide formyltransferase [Sulfurimonas sp.]
MKKIIILFSGDGFNAKNIVNLLHKKKCIVVCGITNNPNAKGIEKLNLLGIKTEILNHLHFSNRESFDTELVQLINNYTPDLVVLSGFMRILSEVFTLNIKSINLHPSLLPKFKGAKAIERSFAGESNRCGVSVHWVNSELDSGNIILQQEFIRSKDDTFDSFGKKIKKIEFEIMPKAIVKALNDIP